jgi:hypothetical protein
MDRNKAFNTIFDFCILGSGPAGIILALELGRLNPEKNILLVEYGTTNKPTKNNLDETIHITNQINHHEPYECTNKGLGGTSATWGGRCVMYDEVDFIDRPIIKGGCTWDGSFLEEIKKYKTKAAEYFECGDADFDLNEIPELKHNQIAENFQPGPVTDSVIERWSMPTRFGSRYSSELAEATNIVLLEGYEARDFSQPDIHRTVSTVTVRKTASELTEVISSRSFIISAGTQESTRILLRNKRLFDHLTEPPKALGRYYQGHLSGKIASVKFSGDPRKTDFGFLVDRAGVYLRRRFQFDTQFLVEKNLLNTAIWLDNPLYYNPSHNSGAMSFMYLAMITPILGKKLAPPAIAQSITKGKVTGIPQHLWNILRGIPGSLIAPATIFYKRYLQKRKLPGVFLYSPENLYALHFHSEQVPEFSNSMQLGSDGETLLITYTLSDDDINSVIKLHSVLDEWLKKCGCGELQYWFEPSNLVEEIRKMSKDGIHQSGTTRIADNPEDGVVDKNLKVWGTENVYVCSSSVFPTSGQANPTFILGAFAVRLADYLTNKK